jgi:FtsP/CotA-like multicopper oxidase with cupredoxin domain
MTRRDLLSTILLGAGAWRTQTVPRGRADVTLRIGTLTHEVAPGHVYTTTAYNGSVPGPIVRLREGVPATIDVINDTDVEEFVHWHGLGVPSEIDGTAEQGSWPVPPRGSLRYTLTPRDTGSRFVHSHAMAAAMPSSRGAAGAGHAAHAAHAMLGAGPYSGQFAHVYVEPRREPGAYDQPGSSTASLRRGEAVAVHRRPPLPHRL